MNGIRIVREAGSFRMIECCGRFAVVELRGDRAFPLDPGERDAEGFPATPEGLGRAAEAAWTDEGKAAALLDDISERGAELARDIW